MRTDTPQSQEPMMDAEKWNEISGRLEAATMAANERMEMFRKVVRA